MPDHTIISVHYPKASGSSIMVALKKAYGEEFTTLYDVDPLDPANPEYIAPKRYAAHKPQSIAPFRAIHGHFSPRHFTEVENAQRIVMLREPVDNLISVYFFWKSYWAAGNRDGHALYRYVMREKLSLLELAQLPRVRYMMSRSYFGAFDMRKFSVIGRYDRRSEYFDKLSRICGLKIESSGHYNKTPDSEERGNVRADKRLLAKLRDLLSDDIRFFEHYTR